MPVITLNRLADLPAAQWDALVPAQQPFLSYAFLSALEDSGSLGPHSGWHPQHLLWQENGEIRAAIPGYRKRHSYGEYVFDQGWADACQRSGIAYYPKWL
ncbi:peptidogalycan biosysnthesis protein, partial [Pseudomonas syringae]|nr:peptidogalycan biosysnthesis protein [Pseudomonas syringae]